MHAPATVTIVLVMSHPPNAAAPKRRVRRSIDARRRELAS